MPTVQSLTASASREKFREHLLAWYDQNKRDLPWRKNRDPYRVWLSEIMLQQTRVAAVLEHYRKFLQRFPSVEKLAAARQATVLAAWSGLGYYRRARMLHAAAKQIAGERGGAFPATAHELQTLAGVGRYTAAAIASIAFGEAVAVVDGNVERVLERLFGHALARNDSWKAAEALLSHDRPGDFNQAMMELGATVCLPRQPVCLHCPAFEFCATRGETEKRSDKAQQMKRTIHYALSSQNGSVFLIQRPAAASLMPGMWELPEIESNSANHSSFTLRHSITVTDYTVHVKIGPPPNMISGQWIAQSRLAGLPLTGLARKILRKAAII